MQRCRGTRGAAEGHSSVQLGSTRAPHRQKLGTRRVELVPRRAQQLHTLPHRRRGTAT